MTKEQSLPTPLGEWLRNNAPDCGDNSCLFGGRGKGGMRTNGGCRCFKDLPTAKRIYVERLYAELTVTPSEKEPSAIAALTEAERAIETVVVGHSTVRRTVVQQAIAAVRKIKNRLMEAADGK